MKLFQSSSGPSPCPQGFLRSVYRLGKHHRSIPSRVGGVVSVLSARRAAERTLSSCTRSQPVGRPRTRARRRGCGGRPVPVCAHRAARPGRLVPGHAGRLCLMRLGGCIPPAYPRPGGASFPSPPPHSRTVVHPRHSGACVAGNPSPPHTSPPRRGAQPRGGAVHRVWRRVRSEGVALIVSPRDIVRRPTPLLCNRYRPVGRPRNVNYRLDGLLKKPYSKGGRGPGAGRVFNRLTCWG